ncbi:MAG: fibronectin type III domain-containing protein, partial [Ruminococcaceae bacterium]|nr:fibronectin type III domain-containing protein [Oscillospiraceae bacterium]
MKGQNTWSYQPYRPFLWEVGDIYICRVVPGETTLHFEWLPHEFGETKAYFRIRGTEEWTEAAVEGTECDIAGLVNGTDYEFYVEAGEKKSRIRLAKCGKSVGTVVNYLHPEDECYAFSGRYLC